MKTVWFEGLNAEDKEEFKAQVFQSQKVLDKLRKIVYNMYKESRKVTPADYQSPSWAYLQAHKNGKVEAFESILSILDIDK